MDASPTHELVANGAATVAARVAATHRDRRIGLLHRRSFDGVLVLPRARQIHTFGMLVPIDVAWCDRAGVVLRVETVRPNSLTRWVWAAQWIVESEALLMGSIGVQRGSRLTLRAHVPATNVPDGESERERTMSPGAAPHWHGGISRIGPRWNAHRKSRRSLDAGS